MNKEIGERIKSVREEAGLSQKDFGTRLGVSLPTISRVEKGHRLPDVQLVIRLAEQFCCDLKWLLLGEGTSAGEDLANVPILNTFSGGMDSLNADVVVGSLGFPGIPKGAFAISWKSDEMMPVVRPGDFVVFRPGSVRVGEVVVAVGRFGRPLVRRLGEADGVRNLVAEDNDYPVISEKDVTVLGPAIEVIRRMIL